MNEAVPQQQHVPAPDATLYSIATDPDAPNQQAAVTAMVEVSDSLSSLACWLRVGRAPAHAPPPPGPY